MYDTIEISRAVLREIGVLAEVEAALQMSPCPPKVRLATPPRGGDPSPLLQKVMAAIAKYQNTHPCGRMVARWRLESLNEQLDFTP